MATGGSSWWRSTMTFDLFYSFSSCYITLNKLKSHHWITEWKILSTCDRRAHVCYVHVSRPFTFSSSSCDVCRSTIPIITIYLVMQSAYSVSVCLHQSYDLYLHNDNIFGTPFFSVSVGKFRFQNYLPAKKQTSWICLTQNRKRNIF